jgi:hypothetical protein
MVFQVFPDFLFPLCKRGALCTDPFDQSVCIDCRKRDIEASLIGRRSGGLRNSARGCFGECSSGQSDDRNEGG